VVVKVNGDPVEDEVVLEVLWVEDPPRVDPAPDELPTTFKIMAWDAVFPRASVALIKTG
jgi:hypothetical protein